MKKYIIAAIMVVLTTIANAQTPAKYNKALADSLGADDYGMKTYVLVMLKSGTNKNPSKQLSDSLFKGHMANISRLATAGLLTVAGPMGKNDKEYRGIFILNVKTIEAANKLLVTDPAIAQHLLDAELYIWYGSAALPLYLKSHSAIEKTSPGG